MMDKNIQENTREESSKVLLTTIFMIAAIVPFKISAINVSTPDVLIPLFFFYTFIDFAIVTKRLEFFFPAIGNWHMIFVSLFMWVVLLAYARNPLLLSSITTSSSSQGGLMFYWGFLCSFLAYFSLGYWANRNRLSSTQLMQAFLLMSFAITLLGMFNTVTGLTLPGLNVWGWSVSETGGLGSDAGSIRAPFLEQFAQIGFFLFLVLNRGHRTTRIIGLFYFVLCIYLGGGRTGLIATVVGLIVWFFLNRKVISASFLVAGSLIALFLMPVINEMVSSPQLKRLTNIGSLEKTSEGRHIVNGYLIQEFLDHPILGTGYGKEYKLPLIRKGNRFDDPERLEKQLRMGSHGAHLQILKNLGLIGYVPFILIWLYPVYKLVRVPLSLSNGYSMEFILSVQAAIVLVSVFLVRMTVEGSGSSVLYFIFAAIMCVLVSERVSNPEAVSLHSR